jgi:hypothetical protein
MLTSLIAMVGCGRGPAVPPFKPIADTKTLMQSMMERQADIVWEAVGETIVGDEVQEHRPRTDEEWQAVRHAAISVTETGNLLMMAPRAQDADRWMAAATELITQGERMIAAIDRKNPKEVFDVGSDLYDACVNCHIYYMPAIKDMYR